MLGQDRARVDGYLASGGKLAERPPDFARLKSREVHGWVAQGALGGHAGGMVVRTVSNRLARVDLGGAAESKQFPRSYEIGPRTAGVVGQPESICTENDVVTENHIRHARVTLNVLRAPLRVAAKRVSRTQRGDHTRSGGSSLDYWIVC